MPGIGYSGNPTNLKVNEYIQYIHRLNWLNSTLSVRRTCSYPTARCLWSATAARIWIRQQRVTSTRVLPNADLQLRFVTCLCLQRSSRNVRTKLDWSGVIFEPNYSLLDMHYFRYSVFFPNVIRSDHCTICNYIFNNHKTLLSNSHWTWRQAFKVTNPFRGPFSVISVKFIK